MLDQFQEIAGDISQMEEEPDHGIIDRCGVA